MDEIDRKQQAEIDVLKEIDKRHDKELDWFRFGMKFIFFTFTLWVIASSSIIFILIDKLDKFLRP